LGLKDELSVKKSANITSTDAVRFFKAALQQYEADVRDAITQLLLETRRAVEWVEHDRAQYWPRQFRRASDAVVEARNALERAESAIRPEDKRSSYEHKLAFEKAKRRLRMTEQKIRAVRKWRVEVNHEVDEFEGRLARLTNFLDSDFPRAIATLQRMAAALDKYTERAAPTEAGSASIEIPGETIGDAGASVNEPERNEP